MGNTNPQGIADPPTADGDTTLTEALSASLLVDGSFVNQDINPYYNILSPTDVNDDGLTTAMDALMIINRLNSGNAGKLSHEAVAAGEKVDFADVNNDGSVSPLDALLVINQLNQGMAAAIGKLLHKRRSNRQQKHHPSPQMRPLLPCLVTRVQLPKARCRRQRLCMTTSLR